MEWKILEAYSLNASFSNWVSSVKMVSVALPVLKKGAKGESVRAMQQLLIAKGFDCGESGADASFGGATLEALKNYQSAAGLEPDGSCGGNTWRSLLGRLVRRHGEYTRLSKDPEFGLIYDGLAKMAQTSCILLAKQAATPLRKARK